MIAAARARNGHGMAETLAAEIFDAFNNTGSDYKKKEDPHKMAEANKAFAHFRFQFQGLSRNQQKGTLWGVLFCVTKVKRI